MNIKQQLNPLLAILLLSLLANVASANDHVSEVQRLLGNTRQPDGVVFEIAGKERDTLNWALAEAERLSKQLRKRFPGLDIAIVTHGAEQFALTRSKLSGNTALNDNLKSLVDSDIQVHVCGTHAERKGVGVSEFTELVDVAAAGPAQINDYIKLGYVHIRIMR